MTKRQQTWQAERRARGECRQCGKPAALKKDGTPAALCDGCKKRKNWGRRKTQTIALIRDVLRDEWRCPDHPTALPMPSRFNMGEYICTVYVQRPQFAKIASSPMVRQPCARKSTDEPEKTNWDWDIIAGRGCSRDAMDKAANSTWRAVYEQWGQPLPSTDPIPLDVLLRKSEYFRWHYRMYQGMPWDRSSR